MKEQTNINISTITIVKIITTLIFLYVLYLIQDILAILFISLILSSALSPWVDWLQKRKIPRPLGMAIIYFILILFLAGVLSLIIPPIIKETIQLSQNFPEHLDRLTLNISLLEEYIFKYEIFNNIKDGFISFSSHLEKTAGGIFSTVTGFLGGIISFILIMVITFYMVVEEGAIKKIVLSVAPKEQQSYILKLIIKMQKKIGLWLRGQIILSIIIFLLIYIGLSVLGVKYALVLALIAGMTEFIPYLGPILAAIPAIFLAFTQSPMLALFLVVLYYIIQIVENNIIVPKVMQKVVGLNPVVSITAILIGFKIGGVIGAMLAIPVATAFSVFLEDVFERKRNIKNF